MKLLFPIGTAREAISLAPVIRAMQSRPELFEVQVCLAPGRQAPVVAALATFGITPEHEIQGGASERSCAQRLAGLVEALDRLAAEQQPDWVLVQGDGTTALAGGLVAHYRRVRLAHVEAGLRTYDKFNPFPGEMNRRIVDLLADLYFAPTERAERHLVDEGVDAGRILMSGSPRIDALRYALGLEHDLTRGATAGVPLDGRILLVAMRHAPDSEGEIEDLIPALRQLTQGYESDLEVVLPFRGDDLERIERIESGLDGLERVSVIPELDYVGYAHLLRRSHLVLTDSDGVQEEAASLGKPVLVMRNETERLDALAEGTVRMVGTDAIDIVKGVQILCEDPEEYAGMARPSELYGDGRAAERIAYEFQRRREPGGDS